MTEQAKIKAPLFPSCRLMLGLMTCLAIMILNFLRVNLSLSVVCMAKPRSRALAGPIYNYSGLQNYSYNDSWLDMTTNKPKYDGEFAWSRQLQGYILSAYFYGYIVTQIVGGWLAGRFGGKHVLGSGILIASIATLVTPVIARFNPYFFIFIRALVGAGTGLVFPSIQTFWGVWAPPLERSILSSFSWLGTTIGACIAMLISSMFCTIRYDNGWPFAFYVTGTAGCLFWIAWNFLAFSSPELHPRITRRELEYIKSCTGQTTGEKKPPFPWIKVITSPPILAIIISHSSFTWFSYTGVTTMPLYLKDVLKFDIKQNGLFMILPYLFVLVATWPCSYLADFLRRRKILSTGAVRKIYQCTCCFGCAIMLIILSFVDHDKRYAAVALLIIIALLQNLGRCGFLVNPQDVAPRFAGIVFGIANTFGTLSGILAPIAVGNLTPNGTQEEWKKVFYIAAAIFTFGGLVFGIFAKGEVLPWAMVPADQAQGEAEIAITSSEGEEKKKNKY